MRRFALFAAGLGVLCSEAWGKAREVVRLRPVEPWNLHYADDSCRMARTFGTGKHQVILVLDRFEPSDWFRMMFVGKSLAARTGFGRSDLKVRFGPNEEASEESFTTGSVGDKSALIVNGAVRLAPLTKAEKEAHDESIRRPPHVDPPPLGEAREAAASWLELSKVLSHDLVLETGSMAKPLAALRECSWETVKLWGLDIDQQKRLTRKPNPTRPSYEWFNPKDYPPAMIRGGYQGIVNFRLIVDEKGAPTSCNIQESTRPKEFDDAVCKAVMKRARFEPALDAQGKPVPSYWRQTVRFVLAA
jgi:TonB family protein